MHGDAISMDNLACKDSRKLKYQLDRHSSNKSRSISIRSVQVMNTLCLSQIEDKFTDVVPITTVN
jgi:hypothetical protein